MTNMGIEAPNEPEGPETLKIPDEVDNFYGKLEAIRRTGAVNMMNVVGVQRVADEIGFHDLVMWLEDRHNRRERYGRLLAEGPERVVELDIGGEVPVGRADMYDDDAEQI